MNKKKLLILGIIAIAIAATPYLSGLLTKSNSNVAELTTASVFDAPLNERCEYQDEIDEKFLSLDPSSKNYSVLYTTIEKKYSNDKYAECDIPEPRTELKEFDSDSEPIVEVVKGSESEINVLDTTYYEKAYNYVPEVPTPVFENIAPE